MCCLLCCFLCVCVCVCSVVKKEHKVCSWILAEGRVASLSLMMIDSVDRVLLVLLLLSSTHRSCFFNTDPNPAKSDFRVEPVRDLRIQWSGWFVGTQKQR